MDAKGALEFAFKQGLNVRGAAARQAAQLSLALRAARTPDPHPALERDAELARRAVPLLAQDGRLDLALTVLLWAEDGPDRSRPQAPPALAGALSAYRRAKAWAAGGGGPDNLLWIRDVPRDLGLREVVAQRLLLCAEADEALAKGLAEAALEAELAALPRSGSFATIFRAAALAPSPTTIERTLAGLQAPDPAEDAPQAARLLGRLRAALLLEKLEAEGTPLAQAARAAVEMAAGDGLASAGALALQLAVRLQETGTPLGRGAARETLSRVEALAGSPPEPSIVLLRAVRSVDRAFLASPSMAGEPGPPDLWLGLAPDALGAAVGEACFALRSAGPAVEALRALDPEGAGAILPWRDRAGAFREIIRAGAWGAAQAGLQSPEEGRDEFVALLARFTKGGITGAFEVFLRALLADEAARFAAAGDTPYHEVAWDLAGLLARRGPGRLERAKLCGRVGFEFVRARQLPKRPDRWLHPYFPTPARAGPSTKDG